MNLRAHFEDREANDLRSRKKAVGIAANDSKYMPQFILSIVKALTKQYDLIINKASAQMDMFDHIDYVITDTYGFEIHTTDVKCKFRDNLYLVETQNMVGNSGNIFSKANSFIQLFLKPLSEDIMHIQLQVNSVDILLDFIRKKMEVETNAELRAIDFARPDMGFAGVYSVYSSYRNRNKPEDIAVGKIDKCIYIPSIEAFNLREIFKLDDEIVRNTELLVYDALKIYSGYADEQLSNLVFEVTNENRLGY